MGKVNKFDVLQVLIIVALIVFMVVVTSSGKTKDVPISTIEEKIKEAPGVSNLTQKTVLDAANNFSFDPTAVAEGLYYRVDDIMNVNELFVARIEDDKNRELVSEALEKYLEEKKNTFEGYGTDQYGLLNDAVITEKGKYLFFGVSPDVLTWESDFLASFR